ncbi:MAG: DNA-formamidopyrimidine glycosylase family protein, partial [Thermoanaerobaculia bacterium]|nr:DNA-formamidopyrimidine glycosylase family protein [Thermoanaerobaculia bacterium]
MPELPDVDVYAACLSREVTGETLERVRLASPFLLRSVDPPVAEAVGRKVATVARLGKRIVIGLDNDVHLVLHLMIAGRLVWGERGLKVPKRIGLAAFDFSSGSLLLREAGSKKRASLHLARGAEGLAEFDRGGLEVIDASLTDFTTALTRENHTLKRSLTDPR